MPGVAPMLEFIAAGTDLQGFSAADKIVGKAAAMLFLFAGVRSVYAGVMSEDAVKVFQRHGISSSYGELVPAIMNRMGAGPCPMEQTVKEIDDPAEALAAIKHKLETLRSVRV